MIKRMKQIIRLDPDWFSMWLAIRCNSTKSLISGLRKIRRPNRLKWSVNLIDQSDWYDTDVQNLLITAIIENRPEILFILVDYGFNVNAIQEYIDSRGRKMTRTPLYTAVESDSWEMVKFLLEHGADPEASVIEEPVRGQIAHPYDLALYSGNVGIALLLNPNLQLSEISNELDAKDYYRLVRGAINQNDHEKLRGLSLMADQFVFSTPVWKVDNWHLEPPYLNLDYWNPSVMDGIWCLLVHECGLDINSRIETSNNSSVGGGGGVKESSFTLLHYVACHFRNYDVSAQPFQTLLDLGADPTLKNEEGLTPLRVLVRENRFALTAGYSVLEEYESSQRSLSLAYFCKRSIRGTLRKKYWETDTVNLAINKLPLSKVMMDYLKAPLRCNFNFYMTEKVSGGITWYIVYHNQDVENIRQGCLKRNRHNSQYFRTIEYYRRINPFHRPFF